MGNIFIINLRHYLTEDGTIAPESAPARKFAEYLCSIVMYATSYPIDDGKRPASNIRCRRRPGRKPCPGEIKVGIIETVEIAWWCPVCGDEGYISDWEGTMWEQLELDLLDEPHDDHIM